MLHNKTSQYPKNKTLINKRGLLRKKHMDYLHKSDVWFLERSIPIIILKTWKLKNNNKKICTSLTADMKNHISYHKIQS